MSTPLPEPYIRYLHQVEIAEFAEDDQHCGSRGCREPAGIYGWYYRRLAGRPTVYERVLCIAHGEDFARLLGVAVSPVPPGAEAGHRVQQPEGPPRAYLARLDAAAIADHLSRGWHCDFPRCRETASFYSSRSDTPLARFLCDPHAARVAAEHGIDITAVPVAEGGYR